MHTRVHLKKKQKGGEDAVYVSVDGIDASMPSERMWQSEPTVGEKFLYAFTLMVYIILSPLLIWFSVRTIDQYSHAVRFRMGRLTGGVIGPGVTWVNVLTDTLHVRSLRTVTFSMPKQEMITKDSVTLNVDAVVFYRIDDVVRAVVNVEDDDKSIRLLAQTTLRDIVGHSELQDLISNRDKISESMRKQLDNATHAWGIKVDRVEIKDLTLPSAMQRAMAAEAEAAREAKAKVVAATGEMDASKALLAASKTMSQNPVALQLRYLQTLTTVASENNSTIVFPFPIDIVPPGTKSGLGQALAPLLGAASTGSNT